MPAIYGSWEQHLEALKASIAANAAAIALLQRDTDPAYGSCFEENETGTAITLTSNAAFYPWVSAATGLVSALVTFNTTAGQKNLVVGTGGDGIYLVTANFAGTLGAANELKAAIFNGATQIPGLRIDQEIAVQAKYQAGSISGLVALAGADVISLRFSSDQNTQTFTIKHAMISLVRVER